MVAVYYTGTTQPTATDAPIRSDSSYRADPTIVYHYVSSGGDFVPHEEIEDINLTDWRGLEFCYKSFSGFKSNKKVFTIRKIPGGDWHHKRKRRLQLMKNE